MFIEGNLSVIDQGIIQGGESLPLIGCDTNAINNSLFLQSEKLKGTKPLTDDLAKKAIREVLTNYLPQPDTAVSTLLQHPKHFYETYFPDIAQGLIREKRWLHFETPNRLSITHEYAVDTTVFPKARNFVYLFSPQSRLAWLRIEVNGQRSEILPSDLVKQQLRITLKSELIPLLKEVYMEFNKLGFTITKETLEQEALNLLYTIPCALPTFIYFSKESISTRSEVVITAQYFDAFLRIKDSARYFL